MTEEEVRNAKRKNLLKNIEKTRESCKNESQPGFRLFC